MANEYGFNFPMVSVFHGSCVNFCKSKQTVSWTILFLGIKGSNLSRSNNIFEGIIFYTLRINGPDYSDESPNEPYA